MEKSQEVLFELCEIVDQWFAKLSDQIGSLQELDWVFYYITKMDWCEDYHIFYKELDTEANFKMRLIDKIQESVE